MQTSALPAVSSSALLSSLCACGSNLAGERRAFPSNGHHQTASSVPLSVQDGFAVFPWHASL